MVLSTEGKSDPTAMTVALAQAEPAQGRHGLSGLDNAIGAAKPLVDDLRALQQIGTKVP
jgi:hypothetical protein